jgi:TolA-binding protein
LSRHRHLPVLLRCACVALLACACATAQKPSAVDDEIKEMRSQLDAQSALVAQQQRRIEELEVKLAGLAAKAQHPAPPPAPAAAPPKEPRPTLKTVKLEGKGRRLQLHGDRVNPVERAPRIPAQVELKEPDEASLERLETDPEVESEFKADRAWANAVQELNEGRREEAERDLLAFASAYPRHSAADNALALAGLAREVRGDCKGALPLLESVPVKYPAGDAVPQAMLERGRCLRILGRNDEARPLLQQLVQEHPDAPEAMQAQRLLQNF